MEKKKYSLLLKESTKDWRFWVKLLVGVMEVGSVIIFITVASAVEGDVWAIPQHLSYYTTQSNVFCGVFFLYSAFCHHNEGKGKFDNSEVAKIAITYITPTILMYNINQLISDTPYQFDTWKYYMSFVCEHLVGPIVAIVYFLFFYNHENAKSMKEFSKKWLWFMVAGLLIYFTVFSIIGGIAKAANWKPLYGTTEEPSTFVYPFMDWYHGFGLLPGIPPWLECIIILIFIVLVTVGMEYLYTLIVLKVKKNKSNKTKDKKHNTKKKFKWIRH